MRLSNIFPESNSELEIKGLSIDSRQAGPGFLHFCIDGLNVDGHDFALDAIKNGAVCIVCRMGFSLPDGLETPLIHVENVRLALSFACADFYAQPAQNMTKIGITGTNGKSSTVHFVSEALRRITGENIGIIGTLGASINGEQINIPYLTSTTPDTIELYKILHYMNEKGVKYLVMEVTSHALALEKTTHINFDIGIFTNLSQDHLDFHKTFENYRLAKAKLFDISKKGLINIDDENAEFVTNYASCDMISYSIAQKSKYQALDCELLPDGVSYTVNGCEINVPVAGKFNIYNTLAAFATLSELGFEEIDIKHALVNVSCIPGRIESVPNQLGIGVIVDYAHTPDGLLNIISSCREFAKGRIITVFGAGGNRDSEKRPIMGKIAGELSDFCIITSDNPRNENPNEIISDIVAGIKHTVCPYIAINDRFLAIKHAIQNAKTNDIIIIAGKGHETYQEFENGNREYFNDKEVAEKIISLF